MAAQVLAPSYMKSLALPGAEGETVVPLAAAEEAEEVAWARVAELEAELTDAKQCMQVKDDERRLAQQQLSRLELAMAKQSQDSRLEQDRGTRVTDLVQQQLAGAEEKVGRLILAVAAAKHRAETAEMALDKAVEQARAEWADAVRQLQCRVAEEESCRRLAEERARELQLQNAALRQQLGSKDVSAGGGAEAQLDADVDRMIRELQQQVTEELNKRMSAQSKLLEKDWQLQEAQEKLASALPEAASNSDMEERLAEKDLQLMQLQRQLADELEKRLQMVEYVAETERKLSDSYTAKEGDGSTARQQNLQEVVRKNREICDLQGELAEELHRRRSVQQQLIEKDTIICQLQQKLMTPRAPPKVLPEPHAPHREADLPLHRRNSIDGEEEPDMEQSPHEPHRDVWHTLFAPPPQVQQSLRRRNSLGTGIAHTPQTALSPPVPPPALRQQQRPAATKRTSSPVHGQEGGHIIRNVVPPPMGTAPAPPGTMLAWPAAGERINRSGSGDFVPPERFTPVSVVPGSKEAAAALEAAARRRGQHGGARSTGPPAGIPSSEGAGVPPKVAVMQQGVAVLSPRGVSFGQPAAAGNGAVQGFARPVGVARSGSARIASTRSTETSTPRKLAI